MAVLELPYGKKSVSIELRDEQILDVVNGRDFPPVTDVKTAVREALSHPIGTKPLKETINAGDKVAIIASDITRAWIGYNEWLPTLLDELNDAGVDDEDILLVVALGAHRMHSDSENECVYGEKVLKRINLIQSHAKNEDDFSYVGTTSRGVKAYLNKYVLACDKVILTGGIVYHSMAGFGGGRKGIVPGIASYKTIQENHTFCLHHQPGEGTNPACFAGATEGNPMNEDLEEIAAMLNPCFLFNVVQNAEGEYARFVAGHWKEAWVAGCKTVRDIFGVKVQGKADLVIASAGGYPKDINMYQATKAVDNAVLACRENSVLILLMECPDIAEPPDFSTWFNYKSLYDREMALRKGFTVPGYVALNCGIMAKKIPHIVVTLPENKEFIENAGMIAVDTIEEALQRAGKILNRESYLITVMPQASNTVPLFSK